MEKFWGLEAAGLSHDLVLVEGGRKSTSQLGQARQGSLTGCGVGSISVAPKCPQYLQPPDTHTSTVSGSACRDGADNLPAEEPSGKPSHHSPVPSLTCLSCPALEVFSFFPLIGDKEQTFISDLVTMEGTGGGSGVKSGNQVAVGSAIVIYKVQST
ncbi:hypothetical protein AOLI_G00085330 [Acnodon oligacanthus]